jgi:hypothetical protein
MIAEERRRAGNGSLPFTGLDLIILAGGALVLLALGFGLRAVPRTNS